MLLHITSIKCIPLFPSGFPGGSEVKASASNAGDLGSIPGLGRSLGEGNGSPLQYSCLENPRDPEPGRLLLIGLQRIGHDWATSLHFTLQRQNSLILANHDDPTPQANDWFWNQGLRQLMLDLPLMIFIDGAVGIMTRLSQTKAEVRKFYFTNRSILSFPILR